MKEEEKIKAGIYFRVSSYKQKEKGLSLDVQKSNLISYCNSKGWDIFGQYKDEGVSASSIEGRHDFERLLEDARNGKFSVIVITKLDRAFRNIKDAVNIFDEFRKRKIDFVSVSEGIDTTTATGRFFFHMISALAELERDLTSERVAPILQDKFDKGLFIGKAPIGYKYSKKEKKFFINEKKAIIVRDIFSMALQKISYRNICDKYKIKPQVYYDIISNPAYIGFVNYKGELRKGVQESIISEEDFRKLNPEFIV